MKGELAVSRLSGGLRAIFLLIYWSLPIKGFFNTQALSVTSWSNNFWCFRIDFCLTIKCSVRSIIRRNSNTRIYFFGFQRIDKVNRNYFLSVEKRRIFSTRNNSNLPDLHETKPVRVFVLRISFASRATTLACAENVRSNNSGHRPWGVLSGDVDRFALTGPFQKFKKHGWVYFSLYALLTDSLFTFDVHTSPSEFVNVSFFPCGNSVHRVENFTNG